jgi:hypothetical protein
MRVAPRRGLWVPECTGRQNVTSPCWVSPVTLSISSMLCHRRLGSWLTFPVQTHALAASRSRFSRSHRAGS